MRALHLFCGVAVVTLVWPVFAHNIYTPPPTLNDRKPRLERAVDRIIAYGLQGAPSQTYITPNLQDARERLKRQSPTPILTLSPEIPMVVAPGASLAVVPEKQTFQISRFQVLGNTVLSSAEIENNLAPFVGEVRTLEDINLAVAALKKVYDNAGYPIVQISLPEQTLNQGVVNLLVQEGRLDQINISPLVAYNQDNILASLPALKSGIVPHTDSIVADIVLANENPSKQVAVNFQSGSQPGTVDAMVNVVEDRIQRFSASWDNSGSAATGFNRVNLGFQHANIANLDHQLSITVSTAAENPDKGFSSTVGYRIPLYKQGASLDFALTYSNSNSSTTNLDSVFNFAGEGVSLGVRYQQNLVVAGAWRHKLLVGLDYKDFANRCTIAAVPVACGSVTTIPWIAGYVGQLQTPEYQAGINVSYNSNIPGGRLGTAQDYQAARAGAATNWSVWRLGGFFSMPLAADWQIRLNANVQSSKDILLPSEQLGIGGANTVRGYSERAVSGDTGFITNLELFTPDFGKKWGEQWKARGVLFYDHGTVRSYSSGSLNTTLASYGIGVRANYGKDWSLKADLGISLTPLAEQTPGIRIPTMLPQQAWGLKQHSDRWGLHLNTTYIF